MLSQFTFKKLCSGMYRVTYTTPHRGDFYIANITDMPIIDATKNAEYPKRNDISLLRRMVKNNGSHYSKYGKKIAKKCQ